MHLLWCTLFSCIVPPYNFRLPWEVTLPSLCHAVSPFVDLCPTPLQTPYCLLRVMRGGGDCCCKEFNPSLFNSLTNQGILRFKSSKLISGYRVILFFFLRLNSENYFLHMTYFSSHVCPTFTLFQHGWSSHEKTQLGFIFSPVLRVLNLKIPTWCFQLVNPYCIVF